MIKQEREIINVSLLLIFFLYFICNTLSLVLTYFNDKVGGDFNVLNLPLNNFNLLLKYYFISIFIILLLILFKNHFINFNFSIRSLAKEKKIIHYVFFVFNIFFFISVVNGIGSIKKTSSNNSLLMYIFQLFQFPYLIIIYLYVYIKSRKNFIYKINFSLYLVSIFITGFLGYLFLLLPLFLNKLKLFFKNTLILFISIVFVLPLLYIFKYMVKYDFFSFNVMKEFFDIDVFLTFYKIVIDRFTYFYNSYEIKQNIFYFQNKILSSHAFDPWFQGYFGSLFFKLLFFGKVYNINSEFYSYFYDKGHANLTFPLISYFDINFFYGILVLFYSIILVFIAYFFNSLIDNTNIFLKYILFVLIYVLLVNGWFWPFMNYLQALSIFIIILLIANIFKKV